MSRKSPGESVSKPCCDSCPTSKRRSGCARARGRRRTAFTTEKIAVLAPIPRASVRIATRVKPGDFRNIRNAYFKSCVIAPPDFSNSSREAFVPMRNHRGRNAGELKHPPLLVAQGYHWIYSHGSAGWDPAG